MRYFLDTSYLIAITHKRDQYHEDAVRVSQSLEKPVRLITTEAILMEYGNMLSQKSVREKAFNYIQILQNSSIPFGMDIAYKYNYLKLLP